MVIMVTADPLLPKLESPPAPPHAEAPPRRARTTLDPPSCPPLCLSFSLPFLRAGGAASFWVYLEAVAVGYGFPTGRGVFAHHPPPFFRPCAVGGWLPRFFDSLLSASRFPSFWAGQTGLFLGFRRDGGGPMRHRIDTGGRKRNRCPSEHVISTLCPRGDFIPPPPLFTFLSFRDLSFLSSRSFPFCVAPFVSL